MNLYDNILYFKGTWRPYQSRILESADTYLKDGKIHIVAPPGSGKTTLGIELIRRLGRPCLILSPTLVIRQQWLQRIREAFLERDDGNILSDDIRQPALITSLTYQSLYSGMSQSDEDFRGFDLLRTVREAGIGTVCLDECHHLRSEWWKALESFLQQLGDIQVVSLTATPPYDSTPAAWKRYISLCGEIDEEIIVPELVRDHSLCPHQDYVYFSRPTREEKETISRFRRETGQIFRELLENKALKKTVVSRRGIMNSEDSADELLEDPSYLVSILSFLEAAGIHYPHKWLRILNIHRLPGFDIPKLEQLLQGMLFDDTGSYEWEPGLRNGLYRDLKRRNCIERKKVTLLVNPTIEKMLVNSAGKMESVRQIVLTEYGELGEELKLLILTDYIRGEYVTAIGDLSQPVSKLGVLPLFEMLRRELPPKLRLGVLCGEFLILPAEAKGALEKAAQTLLIDSGRIVFREINDRSGLSLGYLNVTVRGRRQDAVRLATEVFEAGYVQVMVGTKSLLGEGWDSPCINALILASFVGSFILSNQMRGRAIRSMPGNPKKTSNIWHLVCIDSEKEDKTGQLLGLKDTLVSEDFAMLSRRMDGVLGVSYTGDTIENGIERLGLAGDVPAPKQVEKINRDMAERAADRESLRQKWEQATVINRKMEVADECGVPKANLKPGASFFNLIGFQLVNIFVEIFTISLYTKTAHTYSVFSLLAVTAVSALFLFLTVHFGAEMVKLMTPLKRLKAIGEGIRDALFQTQQIESDTKVVVEEEQGLMFYVCLTGGTAREKDLFAACVSEFMGEVDNQRYLLYAKKRWRSMQNYFCVPELFAKNREDADLFARIMHKSIGPYRLVYTRNEKGRKILLKGRKHAYANQVRRAEDRMCRRKRRIKGALE